MLEFRKPIGFFTGLVLFAGLMAPAPAAGPPTFEAPIFTAANKPVGIARFVAVQGGGTEVVVHIDQPGLLAPGQHALVIHEVGSCNGLRDTQGNNTPFGAAGGHFDPAGTKHHLGPTGTGHAGDLPMLTIDSAGTGGLAYYAPNLQVSGPNTIVGRSIIIHAAPDTYTDTPADGGGGARIACGEIGAKR